jgi:hypothetical protein
MHIRLDSNRVTDGQKHICFWFLDGLQFYQVGTQTIESQFRSIGRSLKFSVKAATEESIVNASRIADHESAV